jgi:hypothetical protein
MILAQELRIGNLVLIPYNKSNKQEGFYEATISQIGDFGAYIKPEDYEPILLTEEWLLKFGFEWKQIKDLSSYTLPKLELYHYSSNNNKIFFEYADGEVELKYVHQLQNLYWVLCGEELTIKEAKK